MEQLPSTTPSEPQTPQTAELKQGGRQRKVFGIVVIISILVIGIGTALWFRVLPGVSMLIATPTPTPGIGVVVQGGGWEVIITNVHQETRLKAGVGFTEQSWTVNDGYVFLVVDVTFRQVDSSSSNLDPETGNSSTTPTPPSFSNSISSSQVALVSEDGMIIPSSGAIFGNGQMGNVCDNCNMTFMTQSGDLEANIVFVMKKDLISGKTFKFQFREVPMIPFIVK